MTRLHLLAHPLLARVVIDIAPDYSRRVYMSKVVVTTPQDVTKLVEAIILGAVDLAARHGITVQGFQITPPTQGAPHGQAPSHG